MAIGALSSGWTGLWTKEWTNETEEIDHKTTLELDKIKNKKVLESLLDKQVGDQVTIGTKGLFKEDHLLSSALGIPQEKAEKLKIDVDFTISEINEREPAEMNQELFFKLFGKDTIKSE